MTQSPMILDAAQVAALLPRLDVLGAMRQLFRQLGEARAAQPAFLKGAQVYCDHAATTPGAAGEMKLATRDHGWQASAIRGDLPGLVCATCPTPDPARPVFFHPIGLGLEDIAMAHALWHLTQADAQGARP